MEWDLQVLTRRDQDYITGKGTVFQSFQGVYFQAYDQSPNLLAGGGTSKF